MTQWGLDTLFNPAKRHLDEEKRRLQSTREEVGDSSGGKRIDLESGKVTIRRSTDEGDGSDGGTDTDADADSARSATPDVPVSGTSADEPAERGKRERRTRSAAEKGSGPSAAAVRAAARRGRKPR